MNEPGNFFSFFVSGSSKEDFQYDPGPAPYYVVAQARAHILVSVIVFAFSEQHAKGIILDAIRFKKKCHQKYINYYYGKDSPQDYSEAKERAIARCDVYLKEFGTVYKFTATLLDRRMRGKVMKVGWASNDTFV